ncbi:MAG: LemA family protein [Planctomycetes bacterium]|nr:LemA family protein [Planctomycetota bacterium]
MKYISESLRKIFPEDIDQMEPVKSSWLKDFFAKCTKNRWYFLFGVVFVIVYIFTHAYYYNNFVLLETQVMADRAQIEVHLQRRKNLSINLTRTVMDYAKHEDTMFKYMAELRAGSLNNRDSILEKLATKGVIDPSSLSDDQMQAIMAKMMALAENYPNLRLSENFQRFMDALVDIENRIVEMRMAYNISCNNYTTYLRQFPQNMLAYPLGFEQFDFIEVDADVADFNKLSARKVNTP